MDSGQINNGFYCCVFLTSVLNFYFCEFLCKPLTMDKYTSDVN